MIDQLGPDARLVWAQDKDGEVGKRPALEKGLFEISAETFDLLRQHTAFHAKRGGRR